MAKPKTGKPKCDYVKEDGSLCKNVAGYKTSHPGLGRCTFHGGDLPYWQDVSKESLVSKVQQYMEDPDLFDARKEMAYLKVTIEDLMNQFDQNRGNLDLVQHLRACIDTISKVQERAIKIMTAKNLYLTVAQAEHVMRELGRIYHNAALQVIDQKPMIALKEGIPEVEEKASRMLFEQLDMPQVPIEELTD